MLSLYVLFFCTISSTPAIAARTTLFRQRQAQEHARIAAGRGLLLSLETQAERASQYFNPAAILVVAAQNLHSSAVSTLLRDLGPGHIEQIFPIHSPLEDPQRWPDGQDDPPRKVRKARPHGGAPTASDDEPGHAQVKGEKRHSTEPSKDSVSSESDEMSARNHTEAKTPNSEYEQDDPEIEDEDEDADAPLRLQLPAFLVRAPSLRLNFGPRPSTWGFVVYRTSYSSEEKWTRMKSKLHAIAHGEIFEGQDWSVCGVQESINEALKDGAGSRPWHTDRGIEGMTLKWVEADGPDGEGFPIQGRSEGESESEATGEEGRERKDGSPTEGAEAREDERTADRYAILDGASPETIRMLFNPHYTGPKTYDPLTQNPFPDMALKPITVPDDLDPTRSQILGYSFVQDPDAAGDDIIHPSSEAASRFAPIEVKMDKEPARRDDGLWEEGCLMIDEDAMDSILAYAPPKNGNWRNARHEAEERGEEYAPGYVIAVDAYGPESDGFLRVEGGGLIPRDWNGAMKVHVETLLTEFLLRGVEDAVLQMCKMHGEWEEVWADGF